MRPIDCHGCVRVVVYEVKLLTYKYGLGHIVFKIYPTPLLSWTSLQVPIRKVCNTLITYLLQRNGKDGSSMAV